MPVILPRGGRPGRGCGRGGRGGGGGCRGSDSSPISASRECATGTKKKMRKSSNKQDSRLCSVVVRTSTPSHAAATQAQAVLAAADTPAVLAVTSVATAPAAASDSAIKAFTEYDKIIEFDHIIDDGGWGANRDEVMGESRGRSLLSSLHSNTTAVHAAGMEFHRIVEAMTAAATLWMCLHLLLLAQ
jgi:hypothetical protein